ncbi:MAG: DeoR/GlpR family DNA-binding transcription regulator [Lachnospiraceae bacterium]|nr:DeoR/GlpR family DNA-binding transcription regulator [Lachnospiraceae bacterium]
MGSKTSRQKEIVRLINENGTVSFKDLKESFPDVSEMTLRTDLKFLDQNRQIVRIHGGAKSIDLVMGTEGVMTWRSITNIDKKEAIAKKARNMVFPNSTVYIDTGSTTTMFARFFPDVNALIYTESISCAIELQKLVRPKVFLPGGQMERSSLSLYGTRALEELKTMNFDVSFISALNYKEGIGFTCFREYQALLKKTIIERSEKVVLLMDSSKVGEKSIYTFCKPEDIDVLVSDGGLTPDFIGLMKEHGVTVIQ